MEREEKFRQEHDKQQQLLADAKALAEAEEKRSDALKAIYEQNESEINSQDSNLSQKMGSLSELLGIVKQIANDMDSTIDSSLVSAQIPGRDDVIDKLADSKIMPEIGELANLWHVARMSPASEFSILFPTVAFCVTSPRLTILLNRDGNHPAGSGPWHGTLKREIPGYCVFQLIQPVVQCWPC